MKEEHEALIKRLAALGGHKAEIAAAREQLAGRAREQRDSMPRTIRTVEDAVEGGGGGGILGHRRLRTLLNERGRLERVIASHEARVREHGNDDDSER